MNEKDMQQALKSIAARDISDHLDRWNEIQARIVQAAPRQPERQLRFALVVVLVIILLLSAGTYVYARFIYHDPGMQGVMDAGLVKTVQITAESPRTATAAASPTVKETQPATTAAMPTVPSAAQVTRTVSAGQVKDGINVTLISYYADTSRIVIDYSVSGLAQHPGFQPVATLLDSEGNTVLSDSGSWDPMDGPEKDPQGFEMTLGGVRLGSNTDSPAQARQRYLSKAGGSLDLQMMVWIGPEYTVIPMGKKELEEFAARPDLIGPFILRFTVMINGSKTLAVNQTQTVNGVAVTLVQLNTAPSRTTAQLCYDLPDNQDWQTEVRMEENGATYEPSGGGLVGSKESLDQGGRRCNEYAFDAYSPEGASRTIQISVRRLQTTVPGPGDFWQKVIDGLAAEGIKAVPASGHAIGVQVLEKPEGMSDEQVQQKIDALVEQLLPTIEGPWNFKIVVP